MGELQAPRVRFAPGFLRRVERFVPELAAARERREGAGGNRLDGAGLEFVGRRPYRAGDDPRRIDWELLARDDRPWVRVLHREAAERWALVLDVSGSMGVGPPGKLQSAAEVALALAAVGVRARAHVTLTFTAPITAPSAGGPQGAPESLTLRRPGDVARALHVLEEVEARPDAAGLAVLATRPLVPADATRVVVLGDTLDVTSADLLRLARPGRELIVGRVLAPCEVEPLALGARAVRFVDPEGRAAAEVELEHGVVASYQRALEGALERLEGELARRRVRCHTWRSDAPFEAPTRALLVP